MVKRDKPINANTSKHLKSDRLIVIYNAKNL